MKTIGMLGGTSWHSTIEYYRIINQTVNDRLGGQHSAQIILSTVDFQWMLDLHGWDKTAEELSKKVKGLESAGADFFMVCSNGLHKVADELASAVKIPMLSIIDATAKEIREKGLSKVGLLGTKHTMRDGFYQEKMKDHGIEIIVPDDEIKNEMTKIIFGELTVGTINDNSRKRLVEIIVGLSSKGAQGVILGCTELPLLIQQEHVSTPVFDTLRIHAEAAATE
jgi:aspartate racemase